MVFCFFGIKVVVSCDWLKWLIYGFFFIVWFVFFDFFLIGLNVFYFFRERDSYKLLIEIYFIFLIFIIRYGFLFLIFGNVWFVIYSILYY